jgi:hypothetical protein
MKQVDLFKKQSKSYGGSLLKTRKGRSHGRPLSTKDSMHLVLRSSKAIKDWSFKKPKNEKRINEIVRKFSIKYGVKILSLANVGNHLHFHIKLANRHTYRPFIRAITAAIAMAVSGVSRWNKLKIKFWDYRPFSRVVQSWRAQLNLSDYIQINRLEGEGFGRPTAHYIVTTSKSFPLRP